MTTLKSSLVSLLSSPLFRYAMKRLIVLLYILTLIMPRIAVAALSGEDIAWLNRITYGINQQTVQEYEKLGRDGFLEKQLHPPKNETLDARTEAHLKRAHRDQTELMEDMASRRRAFLRTTKDTRERSKFNTLLRHQGRKVMADAQRRHMIRAIYSPWQLKEQMSWFWLNHFSVFSGKADTRWMVGDYEDNALRPHALGKFKDLLLATMTHPAMLNYLDASRNTKDKLNENYGRELLELHTMGVNSGYTQKDVTEVARLLTGIKVNFLPASKQAEAVPGFFRKNGVQFSPEKHDFGNKLILGKTIKGAGWSEIETLADLLAKQPATATHLSRKLAQFFIGDKVDGALTKQMSQRFLATDGDITETLEVLFKSPVFKESLKGKYRTPIELIVSTARLAYESRQIRNYAPFYNQLKALDQGLYMRVTPDGYPMAKSMWDGSSQLFSRFEAVRILSSGNSHFFQFASDPEQETRVPNVNNTFFNKVLRPHFSKNTLAVLDGLENQPLLWNAMFFSSPEWMNREFK